MPHFTRQIEVSGPLLNVQIGVSLPHHDALIKANLSIPPPVFEQGLVDTGASITSIDPNIVSRLNLQSKGNVPLVTPSTGNEAVAKSLYDVSIRIYSDVAQSPLSINVLPVLECDLANQGFQVLVG